MKEVTGLLLVLFSFSCQSKEEKNIVSFDQQKEPTFMETKEFETATLAGGCFWCTEAVFLELNGVKKVVSGYTGGTIKNPTYREVSAGTTGHAEAIEITFDPKVISYKEILEIFFETHDPTTLNRQGADVGTQYRSEIFYHSEQQREIAQAVITDLDSQMFGKKIVTRLSPATVFYKAEDYHQDYYSLNSGQPYCQMVISPKLEKLRKKFASKLKN